MTPAELTPGQRVYRCQWHGARTIDTRNGPIDVPAEFAIWEAEVLSVAPVSAVLKHFWEHGKPTTHRLMEGALREWYPSANDAAASRVEQQVRRIERTRCELLDAEADLIVMSRHAAAL